MQLLKVDVQEESSLGKSLILHSNLPTCVIVADLRPALASDLTRAPLQRYYQNALHWGEY